MANPLAKRRAQQITAMSRLFEELADSTLPLSSESASVWRPPTDVYECNDVYVVRMAVSGLRTGADGAIENAEVLVENDVLIVRGRREESCPHTHRVFFQMEIHYGHFECRVRIAAPFQREGIRAAYRDGFLDITIPKAPKTARNAHRISVKA